MLRSIALLAILAMLAGSARGDSACPAPDRAMAIIRAADLALGARTARFEADPPFRLYEKAVRRIDSPQLMRDGKQTVGVIVTRLPIETLWKAVNDDEHHGLDGKYIPVKHSEVIAGTVGAPTRDLFQYYQQMGVGRWWVSRLRVSDALYEKSRGRLWELTWVDLMEQVDRTKPPIDAISSKMTAIRSSEGAWLLVPLAERCVSIEYYSRSEPGGVVGALQPLLVKRALRDILEGIVRLAGEHVASPHPETTFEAPDGRRLE